MVECVENLHEVQNNTYTTPTVLVANQVRCVKELQGRKICAMPAEDQSCDEPEAH